MGHELKARAEFGALPKLVPEFYAGMLGMTKGVAASGIEHELLELIKIRASQINGCAFCLNMHVNDARKMGVSEERLQLVAAWRESPVYSVRERAALGLCEAVTLIAEEGVPDEVWAEVTGLFSEKEAANLVAALVVINGWNRASITYRLMPQVKGAGGA